LFWYNIINKSGNPVSCHPEGGTIKGGKQSDEQSKNTKTRCKKSLHAINDTSVLRPAFKAPLANWRMLLAVIDVVAVVLFVLALRALLEDRKLRKAIAGEKKNS